MHIKLKFIREYLNFTLAQISSLLNVSSYKYKRFENGTLDIETEILILISFMFDIKIDYLINEKISIDEIKQLPSIKHLIEMEITDRIIVVKNNLCSHYANETTNCNYRVIRKVLNVTKMTFKKRLYEIRNIKSMDIIFVSEALNLKKEVFLSYENGKELPSPMLLLDISRLFDTPIQFFFE